MAGCRCKGNNGGGHRERGRPYGLMLLLAVEVALVGVMALHRLRERHIQNVLLKDKDRELFSLHLLLQVILLLSLCDMQADFMDRFALQWHSYCCMVLARSGLGGFSSQEGPILLSFSLSKHREKLARNGSDLFQWQRENI